MAGRKEATVVQLGMEEKPGPVWRTLPFKISPFGCNLTNMAQGYDTLCHHSYLDFRGNFSIHS